MSDVPKAIAGLVIFVALLTLPVWYMLGAAEKVPVPQRTRTEGGPRCIEDNMVAVHMGLLSDWRDEVVRGDGSQQVYASKAGPCEKSLTRTCLKCHSIKSDRNSAPSCSGCHEYADVRPTCWGCHVEPKRDQP